MISVQSLHSFKLAANAKQVSTVTSEHDLSRLVGRKNGVDFVLLGEGSNTVFLEDYYGEVIKIEMYGKEIEEDGDFFIVTAKASENWHEFVSWLLKNNINGLENLALIPGTVGAAPVQNIGAYGVELQQFVLSVNYFDIAVGKHFTLSNDDCNFGYRDSVFKHSLKEKSVITEVVFQIPKRWVPVCTYGELSKLQSPSPQDIFDKVIEIRQSKLPNPNVLGNAGSFFKNPIVDTELAKELKDKFEDMPLYPLNDSKVKLAAGWLIDQCGLKGFEKDGVGVHKDQALVLVNHSGEALGEALLRMINEVKRQVLSKFNIELVPEVRLIGKNGEKLVTEF